MSDERPTFAPESFEGSVILTQLGVISNLEAAVKR
jgi:hypothetical protein